MSDESEAPVAGSKRRDPPSPPTSDDEFDENEAGRLNWRMDPEESHSDWSIEILVAGKTHSAYNVHKSMLAVRSEYFARLFSNKDLKEHETQTSRIEMEELAAKAFPVLLDFVYSLWDDDKPPITCKNSVALHHLGGYFEVRGLRKKARDFWDKDMDTCDLAIYYEHAKLFHDEKAYQAAIRQCCNNILCIEKDDRLIEVSDAQFWLDVVKQNQGQGPTAVSTLISDFCSKHKEQLGTETFGKLTNDAVLPAPLSADAAIELLELEVFFLPSIVSADDLSNLQERCVEALNTKRKEDPDYFTSLQPRLKNPLILSKMLALTVEDTRKLHYLESYLPFEVIVSGAGTSAVNGTYTHRGDFSYNAPRFAMDGVWNGVDVKFEMVAFPYHQVWCISIRDLAVDFYRAVTPEIPPAASVPVPPSTDWELFDDIASFPAPTVVCRYRNY